VIWVKRETKYFCEQDWTAGIRLIRFNKLPGARSENVLRHTAAIVPRHAASASPDDVSQRRQNHEVSIALAAILRDARDARSSSDNGEAVTQG
jgi:hypothetical protein